MSTTICGTARMGGQWAIFKVEADRKNLNCENDTEIHRLIDENQTRLFGFILSICPNRLLAEDILQETNRVVWEKRAVFEINTSFISWAMRIARNQTLAHIKSSRSKHWLLFNTEFVEAVAKRYEERESDWDGKLAALRNCVKRLSIKEFELIKSRYSEKKRNR